MGHCQLGRVSIQHCTE